MFCFKCTSESLASRVELKLKLCLKWNWKTAGIIKELELDIRIGILDNRKECLQGSHKVNTLLAWPFIIISTKYNSKYYIVITSDHIIAKLQ